jgi:hypothetical protein
MFRIAYPFDPDELDAEHPPLVADLISMKRQEQKEALFQIGRMIAALKSLGLEYGFAKKLKSTPIYELKTHVRGGQKGGTRTYFFRAPNDVFMICHAETKTASAPDPKMLEDTAYILEAFENGVPVFPTKGVKA